MALEVDDKNREVVLENDIKLSPAVLPDTSFREPIVKTLLAIDKMLAGKRICDPAVLKDIRNYFQDKKVIVIDLDGVLAGKNREANTDGMKAVKELKSLGYSLVLWTSSNEQKHQNIKFLEDNEVLECFDLAISAENYSLIKDNDPWQELDEDKEKEFFDAVDSAEWLSDEEKEILKSNNRYELKFSPVLFKECLVIDDRPMEYHSYIVEFRNRIKSIDPHYHFLFVGDIQENKRHSDLPFFGIHLVQAIKEKFPK